MFYPPIATGSLFCGSSHFPPSHLTHFFFFQFSDVKTFLHSLFGECLPVIVFRLVCLCVCVDACARLHMSLPVHFDLCKPVLYISCLNKNKIMVTFKKHAVVALSHYLWHHNVIYFAFISLFTLPDSPNTTFLLSHHIYLIVFTLQCLI